MEKPLTREKLENIFRTSPSDPTRIINREISTIEFKESYSTGNMSTYLRTMAAFANNRGGYIIFGVKDKPRQLAGLHDKSLNQFESLSVEVLTNLLSDYFSPEIVWEHCTFEFHNMKFGVIYVFSGEQKPCVCKKVYDNPKQKHSLKAGEIYYRYSGRSEKIHFEELMKILNESRERERREWLRLFQKIGKIGVENAALLDVRSGELSGHSNSVIIDKDLLDKIAFIQEGRFVDTGGIPALRVIGNVTAVDTGKIIVEERTKKVVRAIEVNDIVRTFLKKEAVDEPLEYVKRICSEASANYPIYYFIQKSRKPISEVLRQVQANRSRKQGKIFLIQRLKGKHIQTTKVPESKTFAGQEKLKFREEWLKEAINAPKDMKLLKYCLEAMLSLTSSEIKAHEEYIRMQLWEIFQGNYEKADGIAASRIRMAICRVDEVLYLELEDNSR